MSFKSDQPADDAEGQSIQAADSGARRRLLLLIAIIVVVGVAGHFALEDWLAKLKLADPGEARAALLRALQIGSGFIALLLATLAVWCWGQGSKIRRAGRSPLPTARLVRDTPIVRGEKARMRGRLLQVAAGGLLLLTVGFLVAIVILIARLRAMP